jgi:seryl-tRNA synthetase
MLDPKLIRAEPERVKKAIADKQEKADLDLILSLDEKRRTILGQVEKKKAERNKVSEEIGRLKKEGQDAAGIMASVKTLGEDIHSLDEQLRAIEAEFERLLFWVPNIPHPSVPVGADANGNVEVRRVGALPPEDFRPVPHWQIGEDLKLFDMERGAKIGGSGFILFTGMGARLERALIQMMIDLHTKRHGYTEISPPFLARGVVLQGTGQLPKLESEMYHVEGEDLYLIPTAEVPVTNIYRDEILDAASLPLKLVAYSPCFRREAGAAGRDTRGLVRVHQFDKVEMVKFVRPETSYDELELLVQDAEDVLSALELPYRVITLCTGDLSFAAAKCYDIEAWAPAEQRWLEVSSCSNFEGFQARRAGIRFRNEQGKLEYVHTLNGSGLALPRIFAALLEMHQTSQGTVRIPDALRPYLDGRSEIGRGST